eukprot:TRINITY_DN9421_c0_g1_i2.p1 TRINITY_DN9421_c0_g1~~TRINITY_DN9421_c0_g1_i2.p1  ORF type:complete len:581 (-),score=141.69 TRINITY_DN9421_c0_g1_i2:40-1782(-)
MLTAYGCCNHPPWASNLNDISDVIIALSYLAIPVCIVVIIRRRGDVSQKRWFFWLFGAFVCLCGFNHFVHLFASSPTGFVISALVSFMTALASFATAIAVLRLLPIMMKLPSSKMLETETRGRIEAEEKMIRSEIAREEAIREAEESKVEFFDNMIHELRTPLSGIIALIDLLKRSSSLPQPASGIIQKISTRANLFNQLLNRVLRDRDSLKEIPPVKAFEPLESITMIADVASHLALEKHVAIEIVASSLTESNSVIGDEAKFDLILLKLVSNAIKYVPPKIGSIKITESFQWASSSSTSCVVSVSVSDNGPGISHQMLDRLENPGALIGKGIPWCRHLVSSMGGHLSIQSKENIGTTVTVTFPFEYLAGTTHFKLTTDASVSPVPSPFPSPSPSPSASTLMPSASPMASIDTKYVSPLPGNSPSLYMKHDTTPTFQVESGNSGNLPRILIVDDNEVNRKIAARWLSAYNLTSPDMACDGKEALEMMMSTRYDVVLMDCMMPVMDGFTCTQEFRKFESENPEKFQNTLEISKKFHRVPIVALTVNAMPQDEERCLLSGMDIHVAKPLNRVKMEKILSQF